MIRPEILYGAETWAVKEEQVNKLEVVEVRYLRAIKEVTRRERENEKRRNKEGIKRGGTEREDTRN
jgi:hypothetical protein